MRKILALPVFLVLCSSAHAQVTALSCSQLDVNSAISAVTPGQTVKVPGGNCSWSNVPINKNLTLQGAGSGVTVITLTGNPSFNITKQSSGVIRVQGFTFTSSTGAGNLPHPITINGPWPSSGAVVFSNNAFIANNDTTFDNFEAGGVIISHNSFSSNHYGDFFMTIKDLTHTASWTTADSFGTNDSTGLMNNYIEDNTFFGGANGLFDCDDNCRIVIRHNTFTESGGFNSHGEDTSPYGMREFEIYNNSFLYPDKTCAQGNSSLSNIGSYIWIRGGSGVIFSNTFDHLTSTCWGTKGEIRMNNRGAEDARPQGACGSVSYPVPHQLGQNNNGSADFTDPIWIWSNSANGGAALQAGSGFAWGNPCGFNWNTFFQWCRDAQNTSLTCPITLPSGGGSVSALGGTPKPGYTPYPYPHPLAAGTSTPIISCAPSPATFPTVNVGSTSSPVTITCSNIGSATETYTALGVSGGNAGDWTKTGGTLTTPSGSLAQGASGTLIYTFTPAAQGPRSTTLTMTGTVNSSVAFTGTGQTSISIPSVPTGLTATSPSGPNAILNWTASTGTVTGYKIFRGVVSGGPYPLIATTTNTLTTYTDSGLANNTYYYVVAAYNSAGTSANSTQASVTVNTQCTVNLFPPSLNFSGGIVGLISTAQNVTVTNTGSATCSSISIAAPSGPNGADFAQTNNCGATLAINASCVISVTETPSTTVPESAAIAVTSNDPLSPDTITLSGTATVGNVLLTNSSGQAITSLAFGTIHTGKSSSTQVVTLTNNSGQIITFSSVAIIGGDSTQFILDSTTCSATLASGLSCTATGHFHPTTAGSKTSTLAFTYTGTAAVPAVTLTGQGVGRRISKQL